MWTRGACRYLVPAGFARSESLPKVYKVRLAAKSADIREAIVTMIAFRKQAQAIRGVLVEMAAGKDGFIVVAMRARIIEPLPAEAAPADIFATTLGTCRLPDILSPVRGALLKIHHSLWTVGSPFPCSYVQWRLPCVQTFRPDQQPQSGQTGRLTEVLQNL